MNAKQYKGIIRRRNARKVKYAKKGKLTVILPKPVPKKTVTEIPQMRQMKQIENNKNIVEISHPPKAIDDEMSNI